MTELEKRGRKNGKGLEFCGIEMMDKHGNERVENLSKRGFVGQAK